MQQPCTPKIQQFHPTKWIDLTFYMRFRPKELTDPKDSLGIWEASCLRNTTGACILLQLFSVASMFYDMFTRYDLYLQYCTQNCKARIGYRWQCPRVVDTVLSQSISIRFIGMKPLSILHESLNPKSRKTNLITKRLRATKELFNLEPKH